MKTSKLINQKSLEDIKELNEDVYLILKYQAGSEQHINKLITKYTPFFKAESSKYLRKWNEVGIFDYEFDDAYQLILFEFIKTVQWFKFEKLINDEAIKYFKIIGVFHNRINTNVKNHIMSQNLNAKTRIPCYAKIDIDRLVKPDEFFERHHHFHHLWKDQDYDWEIQALKHKTNLDYDDEIIQNQEFSGFMARLDDRQSKIIRSLMDGKKSHALADEFGTSTYYMNKEIKAIHNVFKNRETMIF